jgi:hypothetical protein
MENPEKKIEEIETFGRPFPYLSVTKQEAGLNK